MDFELSPEQVMIRDSVIRTMVERGSRSLIAREIPTPPLPKAGRQRRS